MSQPMVSRGFRGRQRSVEANLPPGQYLTNDFPVLSAGPTPRTQLAKWDFTIVGTTLVQPKRWTWDEFQALPRVTIQADIHCVTRWSKLGTRWEGVALDTLLARVQHQARFVIAYCDGGYSTNLPLNEVLGGKAWVVDSYEGAPLAPEHGGPARLLVPHRYFWKSTKWVRGLELSVDDRPGFWESLGYHNDGDPWREQRYQGD